MALFTFFVERGALWAVGSVLAGDWVDSASGTVTANRTRQAIRQPRSCSNLVVGAFRALNRVLGASSRAVAASRTRVVRVFSDGSVVTIVTSRAFLAC